MINLTFQSQKPSNLKVILKILKKEGNGPFRINLKKEFGNNGRRVIKKKFTCYNDVQRSELNRTFDISSYPSIQEVLE